MFKPAHLLERNASTGLAFGFPIGRQHVIIMLFHIMPGDNLAVDSF